MMAAVGALFRHETVQTAQGLSIEAHEDVREYRHHR